MGYWATSCWEEQLKACPQNAANGNDTEAVKAFNGRAMDDQWGLAPQWPLIHFHLTNGAFKLVR